MTIDKRETSEGLPHSTGASAQCSVMTYMEKESKKDWVCVYVQLIHFAVEQKYKTVNQPHSNKINFKKKMEYHVILPKKPFVFW